MFIGAHTDEEWRIHLGDFEETMRVEVKEGLFYLADFRPPAKDSVRFRVSQIVENTKTCNRVIRELTGNFRSSRLSVDQVEAVLWRMDEKG